MFVKNIPPVASTLDSRRRRPSTAFARDNVPDSGIRTPIEHADRMSQGIVHIETNFATSQFLQWIITDEWYTADGPDWDGPRHPTAATRTFYQSHFVLIPMKRVPFAANAGACR